MAYADIWRKGGNYVPAGSWYAVIFWFSAQTGHRSSALSDGLAYQMLERFRPAFFLRTETEQAALWNIFTFCLRKSAHMASYFILAWLLMWAIRKWFGSCHRASVIFLLCAVLAALDEFHQTFVPGRSGQFRDVLIDLIGAGVFLLLWAVCRSFDRLRGHSRGRRSGLGHMHRGG